MPTSRKRIAIVGGGPTAVYTLRSLLQKPERLSVTLFEAGRVAGCGIPYSEDHNSPEMMANITSVEIPPVLTSLADWLRAAPQHVLDRFGLSRDAIGERDFYPRVLIGSYYTDQLHRLVTLADSAGHVVNIATETRVSDIAATQEGFALEVDGPAGKGRRRFDAVVMATGHLTDLAKPKSKGRLFRSPYPSQTLQLAADGGALILGSSLSAIDAVVALATRYGRFTQEGDKLIYRPTSDTPFRLVMASRKGVIPDADFYYPIPEEPLLIFTPARLLQLQKQGKTGYLARTMAVLKAQLRADDPAFVEKLGIKRFTPEAFAKAYFEMRKARRSFSGVARDLAQSRRNYRNRHIVMWRYTLMRAHEVFSQIVPFFDRKDLARFQHHLVPVFADAYGCVPHLSIERLLALHRSGHLRVVGHGDTGTIRYSKGQFHLQGAGKKQVFGTLIDARGQDPASVAGLGFSKLDQALDTKDFLRRDITDTKSDQFRLPLHGRQNADIFCLAIPLMMKRYPFAQGLVACADAAEVVAEAI